MNLLRGALRTYAWGSRTAIAEFTGKPSPTAHPEAELWFGAHPGDPAWLETDGGEHSLLDAVRSDPEGQLGAAVRSRFGDALPFLMKVLAADEPLSLQAHPSAEQAAEGFAREDRLGIPVSSPIRNYRDRSHKPELLVALHTFEVLAGFRPAPESVELMRALAVSDLDPFVNLLSGQPDADGLRALFTTWITAPQPDLDLLVPVVIDGAINYLRAGRKQFAAEAKTVLELGERYPGDAGVLASLLLNRFTLRPGDGIYLPAGNLHTYLHGVGIEVMANSETFFAAASRRNTSTCRSCCGCWTSRPPERRACTRRHPPMGWKRCIRLRRLSSRCRCWASTGTYSAMRWTHRRATTARRSCCARKVLRSCTPNRAR